jgi:Sec-independent protein translocase protein TatA|tara:strand:+ start:292 stop:867 length:576 start_codon:yes stop_codon:yes gene_type:complete
MVFGVSATTMVVVLGAGALALGPRDVPLIAKFLGRATGRAVAHVSAFTRAIERSTSGNELRGIRADVRASIKDIRGVAREIERELTPLGRAGEDEDAAATTTTTTTRARERTPTCEQTFAASAVTPHERVIPVNARSLGATPASGSFGATGSDVLAASYKERDVAYRAAKLMESGAIDEYLAKRERESNSE